MCWSACVLVNILGFDCIQICLSVADNDVDFNMQDEDVKPSLLPSG